MWRFGLAQTRTGWRRLLAAGTAVALGSLFVTVILLTSGLFRGAALKIAGETMHGADYVIVANPMAVTAGQMETLENVSAYYIKDRTSGGLRFDDRISSVTFVSQPESRTFDGAALEKGRRAANAEEITLSRTLADRLGATVGDDVELLGVNWNPETQTNGTYSTHVFYKVVGITDATEDELWGIFEASLITSGLNKISAYLDVEDVWTEAIYVTTDNPTALEDELRGAGWVADSYSSNTMAEQVFQQFTGMSNPITTLSILFSIIALSVAGLVVGNTLQVIVSQRATIIGTLRSVGATRGQIRRTVVLEAAVIGTAGGVLGMAAGHVLVALGLSAIERSTFGTLWETNLRLGWPAIVIPILSAVLVTLAASLVPARAAAAVKPLAAVRRLTSPRVRPAASTYLLGAMLVILGLATTLIALFVRTSIVDTLAVDAGPLIALAALGVGIFGIGLLTTSPALFPGISRAIGACLQQLSPRYLRTPVRLARTNLRANTRRTIATSNALMIGVALVTLLVTGTATSRASLGAVSAGLQPADIVVNSSNPAVLTIPEETIAQITAIDGVEAIAPVWSTGLIVSTSNDFFQTQTEAVVASPDSINDVSYADGLLTEEDNGSLILDPSWGFGSDTAVNVQLDPMFFNYYQMSEEESVDPLEGMATSADGPTIGLTVKSRTAPMGAAMLTTDTAETLGVDTSGEPTQLWIRTDPDRLPEVARAVAIALPADEALGLDSYFISTPGDFRANTDEAISTVVTTAAGLLAISIIIALVGVANTLALSVFERRRELALLRSVGLTRRQLRFSLAAEGLIITTVATLVGVVVGAALGTAGSLAVFAGTSGTHLVIPWASIGVIVALALVAGPLASALPARQALRDVPIEALAEE